MAVTTSWVNQTEMNRSLEKKFEGEGEIKKAIQIQIWIKWEKSIGAEFRRSTFLFNLKIGHTLVVLKGVLTSHDLNQLFYTVTSLWLSLHSTIFSY